MGRLCCEVINRIHEATCVQLAQLILPPEPVCLDVGMGDGQVTEKYSRVVGSRSMFGVDISDPKVTEAQSRGIKAFKIDLETDGLPFETDFFDLVICNQVFEHLKQIYRPISEIHRVSKPKGILIFSVPNLASFHNRLLLVIGIQPTSIRIFGPHVRGFTYKGSIKFLTFNDLFRIRKIIGIGFYPLPMKAGGLFMGKVFKSVSHTNLFILEKRPSYGRQNWLQYISSLDLETNYEGPEHKKKEPD